MSWIQDAIVYQIYPLGLTGAPIEQDGVCTPRLLGLVEGGWIEHIESLSANCLLLNPVFVSTTHGYDTEDYLKVDPRLGAEEDLKRVVNEAHARGIRVLFDAVFNHVGRNFWAFQDVLQKREESAYKEWFHIDFSGNNRFGDNLSYACWEGVDTLPVLNHANFELNDYLKDVIVEWVDRFGIDGLRLDVAYALDPGYLAYLRRIADEISEAKAAEFWLLGECLHGDYNLWMGDTLCHSVTNYEAYKGLWSSVNSHNMHEIAYSLNRQFGSDPWCLYTGKTLLNFLDNHDVDRIATKISDPEVLGALWGLLFAMPGVPSIYYGSEWGALGQKLPGDYELRPHFARPEVNDLTERISLYARVRLASKAIRYGSYKELFVAPDQLVFERTYEGESVLFAINIGDSALPVSNFGYTHVRDLLADTDITFEAELELLPKSCRVLGKKNY